MGSLPSNTPDEQPMMDIANDLPHLSIANTENVRITWGTTLFRYQSFVRNSLNCRLSTSDQNMFEYFDDILLLLGWSSSDITIENLNRARHWRHENVVSRNILRKLILKKICLYPLNKFRKNFF